MLPLEHPTDDSTEIVVGFMREVGAFATENFLKQTQSSWAVPCCFE